MKSSKTPISKKSVIYIEPGDTLSKSNCVAEFRSLTTSTQEPIWVLKLNLLFYYSMV